MARRLAPDLDPNAVIRDKAAAIMSRVETSSRWLGYPVLSVVTFLVAAAGALVLAGSIVFSDRRDRPR